MKEGKEGLKETGKGRREVNIKEEEMGKQRSLRKEREREGRR